MSLNNIPAFADFIPKKELHKLKLFLYGTPMVGKTTLASTFPNPLILSTDGNTQYANCPVINLFETPYQKPNPKGASQPYTFITNKWLISEEVLNNLVANKEELKEKGYETIIIDTIDHLFQWNEEYMLEKLGFANGIIPSNDFGRTPFMIKKSFLKTFNKVLDDLNKIFNIVLIGHEAVEVENEVAKTEPFLKSLFSSKKTNFKDFSSKCDIVAYLDTKELPLKNSKEKAQARILYLDFALNIFARNRLGLTGTIIQPTYEKINKLIKEKYEQ